MHEFPKDFYDETLKIVLLGEIRKMTTFKNAGMSNISFFRINDKIVHSRIISTECVYLFRVY